MKTYLVELGAETENGFRTFQEIAEHNDPQIASEIAQQKVNLIYEIPIYKIGVIDVVVIKRRELEKCFKPLPEPVRKFDRQKVEKFIKKEMEFNSVLIMSAEQYRQPERAKEIRAKNAALQDVLDFIQINPKIID